jgi:hypothetical protein
MNAIDRANRHASRVFNPNAGLGNNVSHNLSLDNLFQSL